MLYKIVQVVQVVQDCVQYCNGLVCRWGGSSSGAVGTIPADSESERAQTPTHSESERATGTPEFKLLETGALCGLGLRLCRLRGPVGLSGPCH